VSNWPIQRGGATQISTLTPASSDSILLANIGTAHTWGAWTELIGSTARHSLGLLLSCIVGRNSGRVCVLELGIGAATAERPLAGPFSLESVSSFAAE
jgi:hypothetical protein